MRMNKPILEVVVNGMVIPEQMRGDQRYIKVRKGQEYKLRVRTFDDRGDVLAVITVDGLSIMNGKEGDIYNSGGYVLDPNQCMDIPGWRLDDHEVATFTFSTIEQSYAHRMAKPTNIGVIGCAFFEEKGSRVLIFDPCMQGISEKTPQHLGTAFGKAQQHEVNNVDFERESEPFHIRTIYYIEENSSDEFSDKNPFPSCQPPPGWQRY